LRFIQFATSDAGQEIVAEEGFVNQIVKKEDPQLAGPATLPGLKVAKLEISAK
jgi:hypothetical protein